jgi:hypothetical protein
MMYIPSKFSKSTTQNFPLILLKTKQCCKNNLINLHFPKLHLLNAILNDNNQIKFNACIEDHLKFRNKTNQAVVSIT